MVLKEDSKNMPLTLADTLPADATEREYLWTLNFGPQHPATHTTLRIVLTLDGERVVDAVPHIGYLHRCAEKIGENLTPRQWIPYTDRMDYLAAMNMNLGWALTIEKLMKYEPPEKGRHLRVIIAELFLSSMVT